MQTYEFTLIIPNVDDDMIDALGIKPVRVMIEMPQAVTP